MRRRRWLKRILITVVSLAVIGYVAFWAFLFNPLESDVENLDGLVPMPPEREGEPGVPLSYVVRGPSLRKLWTEGFAGANVRGGKAFQALVDRYELEQYLFKQVRDVEEQIRVASRGMFEFDVLDDIFGREFLLAGDVDLDREDQLTDSPYLFLTRVTWKGKLLDVLQYDSVRERVEQATRGAEELDEGYRIDRTRYWFEVSPPSAEFSRDGETVQKYYFARIRDVLAVSNREELIEGAVRCAERDGEGSIRFETGYKKSFAFDGPEDDLRLWISIDRLDRKGGLTSMIAPDADEPRSMWQLPLQIVPPSLVWDLSLDVRGRDPDRLEFEVALAEAKLGRDSSFPEKVDSAWRARPFDHEEWVEEVGEIAPRESTILAAQFAIEPGDFFVLLLDQLRPNQRSLFLEKLVEENLTAEGFASDVGSYFENRVGVVMTRLDDEVDGLPLDDPDTGGDVDPVPGVTLVFRFRSADDIGTLLDYLARRVPLLSVTMNRRPEKLSGHPDLELFPLKTDVGVIPEELKLVTPVLAVKGDRFFISTNRTALLEIVGTDPADSFAALPEVESLRERLPETGGIYAIVRGSKLRQLLADGRWAAASEAAAAITESPSRLREERFRLARELSTLYPEHNERNRRIEEELRRWVETTNEREFAAGLKRRRDAIESLASVRAIGMVLTLDKAKSSGRLIFDGSK